MLHLVSAFGLLACTAPDKPSDGHPSVRSVSLSPAEVYTDDVLTATVVGAVGDVAFTWYVDDVAVSATSPGSADTATLDGSFFAKGQSVRVEVTATDGGDTSDALASDPVTVLDSPPTAPTVVATDTGDGLACEVTVEPTDLDGDAVTTTLEWATTGFSLAGDTVPLADTARGATWTCTATPNDGDVDGPPGTASITLEGPVAGQYAFEKIADLMMPVDLLPLPDGTLLVATLMGEITDVDPATGDVLGSTTLYDPDDLVSLTLDPRFGDGDHDWVYTWTNHTCILARHKLSLHPFGVTETQVLDTLTCPEQGGHAGGDLSWWSPDDSRPALYLGVGPTIGANPQEQIEPGMKLLAYAVSEDGTVAPGVDSPFTNPYIAALGLRNPWRLADCGVGLCLADAGSDFFEEVNFYTEPGMNFGYPREEGPGDGTYDDPIAWWEDESDANVLEDRDGSGRSGFVNTPMIGVRISDTGYAGRLAGELLYADVYDGWIRGLHIGDDGTIGDQTQIAYLPYVLAMTEAADGTVYAVSLAGGVYRLDLRADRARVGDEGERLSDAGRGGIAYDVRYPLWSNGADKGRFLEIPAGSTIDTTDPDAWVYPDGTRLWKDFSIDGEMVETRLIEKLGGEWLAGVYVWDGDDAYLTDGTRQDLVLPSGAAYTVPSQFACKQCHEATMGHEEPLGPNPFQLGDEGLAQIASVLDVPPGPAPQLTTTDPIEAEVRGYLAGNCSYCHQPAGVVSFVSLIGLDFRYDAVDTGLFDEVAQYWHANPYSNNGLPLVVPGDPDGSALVGILEEMDMPPLAVNLPDEAHIATVRAWIAAME